MKFKNFIIVGGLAYGCYVAGKCSGIVKTGKAIGKIIGESKTCTVMYDILKNEVKVSITDKED